MTRRNVFTNTHGSKWNNDQKCHNTLRIPVPANNFHGNGDLHRPRLASVLRTCVEAAELAPRLSLDTAVASQNTAFWFYIPTT